MDYEEARSKAVARLARIQENCEHPIVIVDSQIRETEAAWYFPYDGREFIESGVFSAALAGNHPVRVAKADGSVSLESPPA